MVSNECLNSQIYSKVFCGANEEIDKWNAINKTNICSHGKIISDIEFEYRNRD